MNMKNKELYRKTNPEEWKKRQKKKRTNKKLKQDRQLSRDRRKYISNRIAEFCKRFRYKEDIHLILAVSDTENMEQVLLQAHNMDEKNVLLSLPILNLEMLEKYFSSTYKKTDDYPPMMIDNDKLLRDIIEFYFKVKISTAKDLLQTSIIMCNIQELSEDHNLIPSIVRVYDYNLWCNGDFAMALGKNIYDGNRLKEMIVPMDNSSFKNKNIFAHQDLITQLLLHKAHKGKIKFPESLIEEIDIFSKRDGLDRSWFRFTSIFGGTNTFYPDVEETLEAYGKEFNDKEFSWDEYWKTERSIALSQQRTIEESEIASVALPSSEIKTLKKS